MQMKKKLSALLLALLMIVSMSACGGQQAEEKAVNLTDLYDSIAEKYDWSEDSMVTVEGDLLESFYPGLADLGATQMIARTPQMSAVVNELVLAEFPDEETAGKAADILQDRVDAQASGGAWYPDSMEAWSNADVITEGRYAAMIASAEHQDEITEMVQTGLK
jgi:hypothetical protein